MYKINNCFLTKCGHAYADVTCLAKKLFLPYNVVEQYSCEI